MLIKVESQSTQNILGNQSELPKIPHGGEWFVGLPSIKDNGWSMLKRTHSTLYNLFRIINSRSFAAEWK